MIETRYQQCAMRTKEVNNSNSASVLMKQRTPVITKGPLPAIDNARLSTVLSHFILLATMDIGMLTFHVKMRKCDFRKVNLRLLERGTVGIRT